MSKNENSLVAINTVLRHISKKSPLPIALFLRPFILQIAIICVAAQVGYRGGLAEFLTITTVVIAT